MKSVTSPLSELPYRSLVKALISKLISSPKSPQDSAKRIDFGKTFDCFQDDQFSYELKENYRNTIKDRWRLAWPFQALYDLNRRGQLKTSEQTLLNELDQSRTYPVDLREVVDRLKKYQNETPPHFVEMGIQDRHLNVPMIRIKKTLEEAKQIKNAKINFAQQMIVKMSAHLSQNISRCSLLEVGCGRGYLTHAMKSLGFRGAVGIDTAEAGYASLDAFDEVEELFDKRASKEMGNIEQTSFDDNSFDVIISTSVLEHIRDLKGAIQEMTRLLKPGGILFHHFDPFFSPRGGHGLGILDFPWGHVRLSADFFEKYIHTYRPYEVPYALCFYHDLFNQPRMTLNEIQESLIDNKLQICCWEEGYYHSHYPLLTKEIIEQSRRHYPQVEIRDLMTCGVCVIAKKGQSL